MVPQDQNHSGNHVIPAPSIVLDITEVRGRGQGEGGKRSFLYLCCMITVGLVGLEPSCHMRGNLSTRNTRNRHGKDATQSVGTQGPSVQP